MIARKTGGGIAGSSRSDKTRPAMPSPAFQSVFEIIRRRLPGLWVQ
jgi:hypothetical protein